MTVYPRQAAPGAGADSIGPGQLAGASVDENELSSVLTTRIKAFHQGPEAILARAVDSTPAV